jgi:hypothetical protein
MAYFSTLKIEVTCSSEMSVDFQRTTRRYVPEDRTLLKDRYKNLKSYKFVPGSWAEYPVIRRESEITVIIELLICMLKSTARRSITDRTHIKTSANASGEQNN